jgi:hypothetical protein
VTDSGFYEIRCESCQASFAPETKRCLHCGAPLGQGLLSQLTARGAAAGEELEIEEGPPPGTRRPLWMVAVVLAIVGSLLRNCQ